MKSSMKYEDYQRKPLCRSGKELHAWKDSLDVRLGQAFGFHCTATENVVSRQHEHLSGTHNAGRPPLQPRQDQESCQHEHLSGIHEPAGIALERALVGLHCNRESGEQLA